VRVVRSFSVNAVLHEEQCDLMKAKVAQESLVLFIDRQSIGFIQDEVLRLSFPSFVFLIHSLFVIFSLVLIRIIRLFLIRLTDLRGVVSFCLTFLIIEDSVVTVASKHSKRLLDGVSD